nr:hypothetical protein [Tanacetum cinerariifolium]
APVNAVGPNSTNSTNSFNNASPYVHVVSPNFRIARKSLFVDPTKYPDDPDMPELEDIVYLDDEEDVGVEADLSNLETNIPVSPIPTTRVYKDHPINQSIGDLNSAPQTRSMARVVKKQGGVHQTNDEDFHTCSKWVFRNKKDERGIMIRIKAILVAHGHTQEEGIDYDEVFSPVARIEVIRLFLAYASFMGFMVYQMDVKSAFLYRTIKEEVYVCQPPGFEDAGYPDKVYKVVKALYGLHQAPRAWYETLANYLLENSFQRRKIDQTFFIKKQKGDILLLQVFRNKKDERGIVVRNKARLMAQGYTQEEGIDYDEMDVKSAFLYGIIEEEVYVYQPPGFEDPHFPNKVYKVKKALYGLYQAPRA